MFSRITYSGNGSNTEFTIPFPFLRADTLQVRSNGVLLTLGDDYTVDTSSSKVVLDFPPAPGVSVQIKRVTPRGVGDRLVVFADPSDITADTLNSADLQLLYIIQEALDDIADGIGVGPSSGSIDPDDPLPPNVENALDGVNSAWAAALAAEVSARAAAITAEANARVAALLGEANARTAAIAAEATLRQTGDTSLASTISALQAVVTDGTTGLAATRARLITEETTRATADSAAATRLTTLESAVNAPTGGLSNLTARLVTVEGALTGGTSPEALAFRVTSLEASVGGLEDDIDTVTARIATEEAVRASTNTALSARMSTVESSVGTLSAAVSTEATARASADGSLAAEYVLAVSTSGGGSARIAGFRVTNLGGGGGLTNFIVQADRMAFCNTSGAGAIYPFIIDSGVVYIDDAHIRQLSVGKLVGGLITGQTFVLATNGGGTPSEIRSSNFASGSAGFTLRSDGYFECSNGIFRGTIYASAGSFTGTINATSGTFSGTVSAGAVNASKIATDSAFYNTATPGSTFPAKAWQNAQTSGGPFNTLGATGTEFWLLTFYGWNTGSGYAKDRFGKSTVQFTCYENGGCTPTTGSYVDLDIIYRVNGGATETVTPYSVRAVVGNGSLNIVGGVEISGLSGNDTVQFGVRAKSPHAASQLNVANLTVECINI